MSGERSTTRAAGGAGGGWRATTDVHITNPVTAMISDTRAHAPMFMDASLEPYSRAVSHRFRATGSARVGRRSHAYCAHIGDADAIVRSDATLRTGVVFIACSSA